MNEDLKILSKALAVLQEGIPDSTFLNDLEEIKKPDVSSILLQTAKELQDNYPYHSPFFIGQMLKPPHPIARMAYQMVLYINPNNHALDGGKASSKMEKIAVKNIAKMFGWQHALGHLSSAGTTANLEALWMSQQLHPGKMIVASEQAHYTHERLTGVLQIPFKKVPSTAQGVMDLEALEYLLQKEAVGTVVVTMGTTAFGAVDPLHDIVGLQKQYGFRIHIDAAYGGYFCLASNLKAEDALHFSSIKQADSIVVDPHKHGLQPYGCGCILFKDATLGKFYKHDSPYTYFNSDDLHLGEISLECSRAGAAAVALKATQDLLPYEKNGHFSSDLNSYINITQWFYKKIKASKALLTFMDPSLDILVYTIAGNSTSEISKKAQSFYKQAEENGLYLALYQMPIEIFKQYYPTVIIDIQVVTCLRSTFMKPCHWSFKDQIWSKLLGTVDKI